LARLQVVNPKTITVVGMPAAVAVDTVPSVSILVNGRIVA